MAHSGEVEIFEQIQSLQQDRPLCPTTALMDLDASVGCLDRFFNGRLVPVEVSHRQKPGVGFTGGIAHRIVPAEFNDGFRDFAAIEFVMSGAKAVFGILESALGSNQALERRSPVRLSPHRPDRRRGAARQEDLGRRWPFLSKPAGITGDAAVEVIVHRKPVPGEFNNRAQHVGETHPAETTEQQDPGAYRGRDNGRQKSVARDNIQPVASV